MPREKQWTVGTPDIDEKREELEERVIEVGRISRTVAGGKRMRFRALVVVGDRKGKVGMGLGKAQEVAGAIAKATAKAKKSMIEVPIVNGTIPFETRATFGSAHVLLKPAVPGTSIIAGGSVRTIMELAGIQNIVSKILGAPNRVNNSQATLTALEKLGRKWRVKEQNREGRDS